MQNNNRNRIGWIILAMVCLGIGVMVGGRGAAFMGMAKQPMPMMSQQSGPMMGRGQMVQPGDGQFQGQQGQQGQFQGQQGQQGPRFHQERGQMMQPGGPMGQGNRHGHGRGGFFGILGMLWHLVKLAALVMAAFLLLKLWRNRNDPSDTRRWPWERRQTPEPGTTDPPYTGNTL